MKKQLLYFSMVGMLLTMNACDDDGKTEFLDDYSTIIKTEFVQTNSRNS